MIRVWLAGLFRRRWGLLLGTTVGVGAAVALIACLGAFLADSQATMTDRAVRSVTVDWQVELGPSANGQTARLVAGSPGVRASVPVDFAHIAGLSATAGSSTRTTGPGMALGLPPDYRSVFPAEIRTLTGADNGVLLAQQTAANLHAAIGDAITIGRAGMSPVSVTVAGIVELPQANSLFQTVGAPPAAQPVAPPDNVVLMPAMQWHDLFDPLGAARPDLVFTQIHVRRKHQLPADPATAYAAVQAAAHNLEARSAGAVRVGDNLGAALDAARSDAAYARVLFLFLGLPGVVLAALLTATVAAAGSARRRAEQALLRVRGAGTRQLLALVAAEAVVIGVAGAGLGLAVAALVNTATTGSPGFGPTRPASLGWPLGAAAAGLLVAVATVVSPAYRELRKDSVALARNRTTTPLTPTWARLGLDVAVLVAAGLVFTATTGSGYQLVLAPEGVPSISVSYWAFAGPALLWLGAALTTWRLADLLLGRGRGIVALLARPVSGQLAHTVAASMARQRRPLVRASVMLALAVAFAVSTATFNATYRQQAEVDAQLTNGADVTITPAPGVALPPTAAAPMAAVPGVRDVEPMQHRFAYVGADLQDLYGVRPHTLTRATALQDSYFPGSSAAASMAVLAARPDAVLVSAETALDFQLKPGDPVTLRIVESATTQPKPVTFHYVGVVNEFPTAPKDSFFVANASYVAAQTGSQAIGAFLVDTGGRDTAAVAARLRALVGTEATVTDISTVRASVGSSLTSMDLSRLTRIELSFALLLAVASGGLVLALGLSARRRSYAVMTALGAHRKHLRAFVFTETGVLTATGLLAGAASGTALSLMLIKVLRGVFDPPPDTAAVPWPYLLAVLISTLGSLATVSVLAVQMLSRRRKPGSM